jgi:hypothetical protein
VLLFSTPSIKMGEMELSVTIWPAVAHTSNVMNLAPLASHRPDDGVAAL